jgi:hypothetical protein
VRAGFAVPLLAAFVAAATPSAAQAPAIDAAAAAAVLDEAHDLCTRDDGALWGVSLCGPMLFVDPKTRQAVGNQAAPGAVRDGSVCRFTVPAALGTANTSVTLVGTRWVMILWPLPDDPDARAVELMHESYHRIQPDVGIVGGGGLGTNGHLDTESGRIWMRGEFHALAAALRATGDARRFAVRDALRMRAYRRSLFAGSAESERLLEMNEGLAESTGIDAGLPPARRVPYALNDLAQFEKVPSYARAFAYATGPAYAELLDAVAPGWRRTLPASADLGEFAGNRYDVQVDTPDPVEAEAVIARYGGAAIESEESARAAAVALREQRYTREFVDGPYVTLPMQHFQITFNPSAVEAFGDHGSVYHTLHVSDVWGAVDVTSGDALINSAFNRLYVPAPANAAGPAVAGSGYTLHLAPGYALAPDPARPGSYVVAKR